MKQTITLQLAKLRKRNGITQRQLAEELGTSFQNVSKWETGATMPDIALLPVLAAYFQVSVDELLGLVPLKDETYLSKGTGSEAFWNQKLEYLKRTRKNAWNPDYLEFLVKTVWKLDKPVSVLDCGCGYGYLGALLLPLLPGGSTYTGVDFSKNLLDYGEKLFEEEGLPGRFLCEDFLNMELTEQYDVVICQSVLRHLGDSTPFIKKMMEAARFGGLIVCIDSNRELECAGLYVDGMDYAELCDHRGAEKHWKAEKENGDRDYAAAMRNAFVMQKLGLADVEVRMNDRMSFVHPGKKDYAQEVEDFLEQNAQWYKDRDETERLISHGMSKSEAENYSGRGRRIREYFEQHPSEVSYLLFRGKTITFGWKEIR